MVHCGSELSLVVLSAHFRCCLCLLKEVFYKINPRLTLQMIWGIVTDVKSQRAKPRLEEDGGGKPLHFGAAVSVFMTASRCFHQATTAVDDDGKVGMHGSEGEQRHHVLRRVNGK